MTGRRFAYADPPYLGCAVRYYSDHPEAARYDTLEAHAELVARLEREYPDGWALSCHVPSLQAVLSVCGQGVRVAAWVKPFSGTRPYVRARFAWEPVIYRTRLEWDYGPQVVDVHSANAPRANGVGRPGAFIGRKPESFAAWVADLVGWRPGDVIEDLFPGSGAVTRAFAKLQAEQFELLVSEGA